MADDKKKEMSPEEAKEQKWEEILAETEGGSTDEIQKKDKKREDKHLKDENKKLTAELAETKAALEKAQSELSEINDKYLRCAAEYDNFRRRSAKEREGIYADAYTDALSAILPVMDNLERAAAYSDGAQLADGIKLIFKSAKESFEKIGVTEFGAPGEQFDPQRHNAMMHI
ncbi:MAG: nucleotide exchange factor GrpE, partial [Clostridia bacterium]|nr:nucleotide exchange factor GrpE [Clostridia bacterium]